MNCDQVEELLPAYALGALEPEERDEVEAHVGECPNCTSLIKEYLETSTALAMAAPPATPPLHLRDVLLSRIEAPGPQPVVADVAVPRAMASAQNTKRYSLPYVASAIAASFSLVLVSVLVAMVFDLRRDLKGLRDDNEQLTEMVNQQRELTYTLASPDTETMMLKNTEQAPHARGMLMVNKERTWALLVSQGLEPRQAMGYQLWLVRNGKRISGGTFTVDKTGYGILTITFPEPLYEYSNIGVTMEPEGGSSWPTGMQVLSAPLQ